MAEQHIYFDSTYRLRVVEEDKFKDTERLSDECQSFNQKMTQFQETIQKLVEGMHKYAAKIEVAKLKALGQRNRVESEKEVRKIKAAEIQSLINEKKATLERLQLQHESLKKVDQEQRAIIERLGNNEA
mmetsp:Transcript_18852/g.38339  ORF Transcript_18852/g.38339 Transcript_18852/m.38339 type:complete len:129 (+) Transcript_18852:289-675(+)|eukprot:CAMPEP_0181312796 /NCGR_PEP_ID=MMETSP1101-20121128/13891_1 /TAXON_ID=46948 /ORGANISM="Rhodomonas abbreviata, Strain Caron Lab Isolate" /LENGTH=128 /DNA_ID=CAMNT_0023419677 /DNA_START=288 /DNA_END=674 /DNA_ORIENTATION=-